MSHGAGPGPEALQPFFNGVNALCQPQYIFTGSVVAFFASLKFRHILIKPAVAIGVSVAMVLFFIVGLYNPAFNEQAIKPDNVPIWIMVFLTGFCLWAAFYQAVKNDDRFRQGLRSDEHEAADEKVHVWPYLLYI